MKLNETRPYLEVSGEMEEQFFSIEDQGMIFDILRNKMYSNPILAICREISCNARDAHREVGTPEVPVQIHIPNHLEPYFKIKDFGPGISPDRMSNIFIKYTASTKRSDNTQTGGFGLGAKTPFSYSDSFSIVTNHDGIQYNYSCNIDETKVGKLILLSKSTTTEPNSTEIIIPVKPKNYTEFATWTEQACRHWDVKPTISGGQIAWQNVTKILEGNRWAIIQSQDWQKSAKMVIDGIEYPLELDTLRKYADGKLIDAAKGHFVMYFGVGELSLSANRESIYLDEKTQQVIRDRLTLIQGEIKQKVADKIESFDDLYQANAYYVRDLTQAFNNLEFLGKLTWRGFALQGRYMSTNCPIFIFTKGKYSRKYGTDPNKLSRSSSSVISFEESSELYVNDLAIKEPTPRHIKKAFEDDPKLKSVQVICPTDKITLTDLNSSIHLDQMKAKVLSSITKASRAYTPSANRLIVFKFEAGASAFRQVSYDSLETDTNAKVLCLLKKDRSYSSVNRLAMLKTQNTLTAASVSALATTFPNYSFYGVDVDTPTDRVEEEFSDFEELDTFVQEHIIDAKTIDYVEIKFATKHNYHIDERMLRSYDIMKTHLTDPNSLYLKRLELHQKIKKMNSTGLEMLHLYESLNGDITDVELETFNKDHPEYDIDAMNTEFHKKYPLLAHVNTYNYNEIVGHIAHYVNLVDKI
jgi:Histidine kinase-, DNA gyrase B-, and HSP90-like ATPase